MRSADDESGIVLGVGPEGHLSEGTLCFVVATAERLGVDVELVHVVPTLVGGPTGAWEVGITFDQLLTQGQARLDEAVARVRDRLGTGSAVSGRLLRGGVVATLIGCSRTAQMVVLEHRDLGHWQRLAEGSITQGVAARAHCPVVSVPSRWLPAHAPRPIAVGVEDARRAAAELWTALGLAAASNLPVVVLRAAYMPQAYQEILRREVSEEDFLLVAREELVRDAQLPESVCAQVPCTFVVRWGKPAEVLVEASGGASLLVLGRRDPVLPFGSHLGPVVRQVLREAECPVMVVEPVLADPITVRDQRAQVAAAG